MAKYGYIATIGANTDGLTEALSQIDDATKKTNTELREINKALKLDPTNTELLAQKYELLGKNLDSAKIKAQGLEKVQEKMLKGVANNKDFEKAYEPLKKELDEVTSKVNKAEKAVEKANQKLNNAEITYDQFQAYRDELTKTQEEQKKVEDRIKSLEKTFDDAGGRISEEKYRKYRRELEQTRISANQLEKEMSDLDNATGQSAKDFDEIEKSVKKYNNALSLNESELKKITIQYSDNADSIEALTQKQKLYENSIETQKQKINLLNTALEESKRKYGENSDEVFKWQKEIADAEITLTKTQKELSDLDNATGQSAKEFRKAVESTKEYQQAMDKLGSSSAELRSKLGGALNDIWNIALKVGTAITSAAVAAGAASVKIGSDFDASMSTVEALSRATGNELETLREKAKEMGATTSKTAKESADALGYMALAGWDTQQMLEGLEPILRASEAGNMDLATASDLVTDSMSAMGIATSDLTHYLDVATKAQSSSNTSLEQLLNAYVVAGGSFKNFNVSLEESATLLGVLANRGIKGSEAGNALNSVLINLIGASGQSSEAMETLGVSAFDTNGNFIGVTKTLEQVSAALAKLDKEQRAVLTAQLGGKTQYDTLQALLSGVNEEYDELLGKIEDSNGALEDTAKIMRDNLKGDVEALKSRLQDLGIEVNDQFTESFREAVQITTKEVAKLSNAVSEGELGESLKKIAEAFAKLIEQIAKFAVDKGIPAIINLFEFIADNGELVKGVIVGIGSAFIAWKFSNIITGLNGIHTSFMKLKISAQESAAAMKAFNNIVKTNIYAAAASALIGMATALKTWLDTHSEIKNLLDETSQAIYNQTDAYNKSVKAAEENAKKADQNAASAKHYWYEVQKLVDEQGNAKGSTDDLNIAVARLNEVAGTNIEVIDGQIQGYKDLSLTMDDYIENIRREAKLSSFKDSYGEALLNIDETTQKYEEALKKREELWEDYKAKEQKLLEYENSDYSDVQLNMQLAEDVDEAYQKYSETSTQLSALEEQVNSYQSVIDKYENLLDYGKGEQGNNGAKIAAEGMIAQYQAAAKKAATDIQTEQEELLKAFQSDMENLDYRKNIHQVDDTAYWNERRQILNNHLLKESEEWWKYYDETEKYFSDLTEAQKEAYEQQINDQAEALKERKELNDDFTDEMYYNELETLIGALDKESDLYKQYNKEILKGRKELNDTLAEEQKEAYEQQIDDQAESFKDRLELQSDYTKEMYYNDLENLISTLDKESDLYKKYNKEIIKGRKELGDDLEKERAQERERILNEFKNIDLTETVKDKEGNDKLILKDLDAEIKRLDKYEASLAKLRATGISDSLMAEIEKLNYASGERQDYIDTLLSIPADKLQLYYRDWNKLRERQEAAADNAVKEELEQTNKEAEKAISSTTDMFDNASKSAYEKGAETAKNFYQGLIDNMNGLNDIETINAVFRAGYTDRSGVSVKAKESPTDTQKFISVNTPISFIIDGKKAIETTIWEIIDSGSRSGGNVLHL